MAKILPDNLTANQNGLSQQPILTDSEAIDGFLGGRLMEKQNNFNRYLQKLEETCLGMEDKDAINILPQAVKTVRAYADKLAKEPASSQERELFLRFAQARGSQTLALLKKITTQKTQNYKRTQTLTYCSFLIKSSKDLYDNPQVLSENADYYAGYIKLLPEYAKTDTSQVATDAIYSAAIQSAIENGNCAHAKAYLADEKIVEALSDEKLANFTISIASSQEKALINTIVKRFNPQNQGELEKSINEIQQSIGKKLISKEMAKKIIDELTIAFNVFIKNQNEVERDYQEKTTLALLGKIISANIKAKDIIDSALPENVRCMLSRVIETENAANTKTLREKKKETLTNLLKSAADGEIITVSDIADKNIPSIDAASLLRTIKAMNKYRSQKYDYKEEAQ